MEFTDRRGRGWSLALDLGGAGRVRDLAGVDVLASGGGWGDRLMADPALVVDVMYAIAKPQCEARGVSSWKFGKALRRQVVSDDAYLALVDAVTRFFPEPATDEESEEADAAEGSGKKFGWTELYELAGFLGVDPRPFTLRDLFAMARGRREYQSRLAWEPASLLAALANGMRIKNVSKIEDFNPWHESKVEDLAAPRTKRMFR